VDTKIADVRAALGTDDIERMRSAKDALQQAMYKVSEQIYSAGSGGSTGGEGQPTDGSGPADDDTVDAQFKEEPQ
jgi:molecular chaperone DnaK